MTPNLVYLGPIRSCELHASPPVSLVSSGHFYPLPDINIPLTSLSLSPIYLTLCSHPDFQKHADPPNHVFKILCFSCILCRVKQITSPGWMHETSAQAWCTGKTQSDLVEREVGGGIGMGNTCKSMADSCQYMTKTTTIL